VHEVSLVADLIEVCERRAAGRTVTVVRVRHATTIPAETLEQAFRMLTVGGRLAHATLETEPFDIPLACGCGFDGVLGHDDVVGSMAICPDCGAVSALHRTAELELLEVVTAA
jgi:Zn finger protein HypA/HybF involved in hydrogenase expression